MNDLKSKSRRELMQSIFYSPITRMTPVLGFTGLASAASTNVEVVNQFNRTLGVFLYVAEDKSLRWYKDKNRDGTIGWDSASGNLVGTGFGNFKTILLAEEGVIYAITTSNLVLYYRYLGKKGEPLWDIRNGKVLRSNFNYARYIYGGDGQIYCIDNLGDVYWFKDLSQSGDVNWHSRSGTKIASGWNKYNHIIHLGNGEFAVTDTGKNLLWLKDISRDGTVSWHVRSGSKIGSGWGFESLISPGDFKIYAKRSDGNIFYYEYTSAGDGRWNWVKTGKNLGLGFNGILGGAIQVNKSKLGFARFEAYCYPQSVSTGQVIELRASSTLPEVKITCYRVQNNSSGATGVDTGWTVLANPIRQVVLEDSPTQGCAWSPLTTLAIPETWESGMYYFVAASIAGERLFDIPFVVRPSVTPAINPNTGKASRVLVIANTNTWNAYNVWGDASPYVNKTTLLQGSFLRPNPAISDIHIPKYSTTRTTSSLYGPYANHLAFGESWFLTWLDSINISYDLYSDLDYHKGIIDFSKYDTMIITTHPEYWSIPMRDRLENWLSLTGRRLLNLSANGLYWPITYNNSETAMMYRNYIHPTTSIRLRFRDLLPVRRPESSVLGVQYESFNTTAPATPYSVLRADHWLFQGTSMVNGDLLGATGFNGPISGWEMDGVNQFSPNNTVVLAKGSNQSTNSSFSGQMSYYDTSSGGFVFSGGSIPFVGAMRLDTNLQRIVYNALTGVRP